MARERMVTRTVSEAEVSVMTVHVETKEIYTRVHRISATIPAEVALKYIQKHFDTETDKSVMITDYTVSEILYGMPEQDFIKLARILPPRSVNAETEE